MIAGIVLAAGGSTRMGRPKMLLPFRGGTILSASVSALLDSWLERVVVVLGCDAERIRSEAGLAHDPRLSLVVNERWREGMASSLRRGIEECSDADAVLVALGDQPGLTTGRVRQVLSAFTPDRVLVVPIHEGIPAHPVLFARRLFPELAALSGDVGAREVVRSHWNEALFIDVEPLADIDTEEDYRRLPGSKAPST
ncbi:MAG TPA: nucleotidyltransferase family protein [Thermoanaerobaculia bacterium]|jgi:molybdenum cofactor cytidylyltransferase